MEDLLRESVEALFRDHAMPEHVRRAEAEGPDRALWELVNEAGFPLALTSGLSLTDACGLLVACGRFAAPIPLGEEILARAYAAEAGAALPEGMVTAACGTLEGDLARAQAVPWGERSDWVMVAAARVCHVFPAAGARVSAHDGMRGAREVDMQWRTGDAKLTFQAPAAAEWRAVGAALRAAQIAGALDTVLELTLRYANERVQFGRPLAKFQALQQQIAVLAEDTFAARMAAATACESDGVLPNAARAGAGKVVASEAAPRACAIAHAVHGAMGIAQEHDLQLFTRRLLAWRMQYGSEAYWSARAGRALVAEAKGAWELVRSV